MPPLHLGFLHWIAWVPLLVVVAKQRSRASTVAALLTPVAFFMMIGSSWFTEAIRFYGDLPWAASFVLSTIIIITTAVPAAVALLAAPHLRRYLGSVWPFAWAALMALTQWLGDLVLLFPASLAITQLSNLWVIQLLSVTGVSGISFVVALSNATLAEMIMSRRSTPSPIALGAAAGLISAVLIFGAWRTAHVDEIVAQAPVLRVGQLQSDVTMADKRADPKKAAAYWFDESKKFEPGSVDLLVWPEASTHKSFGRPEKPMFGSIPAIKLTQELRTELVAGSSSMRIDPQRTIKQGGLKHYNSATLISDGKVAAIHDKARPMPFAEYLPMAAYLPQRLRELGEKYTGAWDSLPSMEPLRAKNHLLGVGLCYELFSASLMRKLAHSDLLITLTNDSWYGDTRAPHLAAAHGALRAVELGRTMVRTGYTGISQVVEPHGRMHSRVMPFAKEARIIEVRVAKLQTVYARWGDWFVAVCAFGLCALLGYRKMTGKTDSR